MKKTKEKREDKKQLVTNNMVRGHIAMNGVRQSPYICPDNLPIVLEKINDIMKKEFTEGIESLRMRWFKSNIELQKWLKKHLETIPEFTAWNERKNGNKAPYGCCDRYSKPHPDNDFIDLDALYRNTACGIWNEGVDNND